MLKKEQLISDIKNMGLKSGDMVNVKVSLKAIGKIEGGAKTLIDAILDVIGEDGTLVCDSFNDTICRYTRFIHKNRITNEKTKSYAGAFVNAVLSHPQCYRSTHPLLAFSAIGKKAKEMTEAYTIESEPYGFLEDMANMNAVNLRMGDKVIGVGTTHVAICKHGFQQKYIPNGIYYIDEKGEKRWYEHFWASGCYKGFNMLFPYYREGGAVIKEGKVGNANSMLTSMKKTLEIEMELFEHDGTAFFCKDPGCVNCAFTWKHSVYSYWQSAWVDLKRGDYKRFAFATLEAVFGTWHK